MQKLGVLPAAFCENINVNILNCRSSRNTGQPFVTLETLKSNKPPMLKLRTAKLRGPQSLITLCHPRQDFRLFSDKKASFNSFIDRDLLGKVVLALFKKLSNGIDGSGIFLLMMDQCLQNIC